MKEVLKYKVLLLLLIVFLFATQGALAQGFKTEFGKNRVQTKRFDWLFYKSEKFDVYYYTGGLDLARFTLAEAQSHIDEIESFFDYRLDQKIVFILYNSQSDYNQSNMFVTLDNYNIGGTTPIQGTTSFIYFDEDHYEFVKNIRRGIANVVVNDMLYGGSIQERLQNSTLLHLPDWYVNGLVNHLASGWDANLESKLRDGILYGKFKKMAALNADEKEIASQSIWEYTEKKYGREAVANVVYVARINKNIESGFAYVLGKSLAELYEEWFNYNYYRFLDESADFEPMANELSVQRKVNKKGIITKFAKSYDNKYLATVKNENGKIKVFVTETTGKHRSTKVYSTGYKSVTKKLDHTYPVIKWNRVANELFIIIEKNGDPRMITYSVEEDKIVSNRELFSIDKVYSFDVSTDGRTMVFAGLSNARKDIFIYDRISSFVRPLTNDDYDDKDPIFYNNGQDVIFSSNRPGPDMVKKNADNFDFANSYDLYSFNIKDKKHKLTQRTFTDVINETKPAELRDGYFSYLSDQKGYCNFNCFKSINVYKGIRAIRIRKNNLLDADDTLYFKSRKEYIKYNNAIVNFDSLNISRIDTSAVYSDSSRHFYLSTFGENVLDYAYDSDSNQFWYFSFHKQKYRLYRHKLPSDLEQKPFKEDLIGTIGQAVTNVDVLGKTKNADKKDSVSAQVRDSFNYYFITGFEDIESSRQTASQRATVLAAENKLKAEKSLDQLGKSNMARRYYLSFTPDQIITQFDNGILYTPYLPYNSNDNFIYQPSLNGFFKVGISDMFKDYRMIGGVRISSNLRESDLYYQYDNLKKRVDKTIMLYRHGERGIDENDVRRTATNEIRGLIKYPFNEIKAIKMSLFVREDQEVYLATTQAALERKPKLNFWAGSKIEYVYDNSIADGLNIQNGLKYKLYTEFYRNVNSSNQIFVIGGDFRSYTKIYRSFIWANRFAFSSSMGPSKIVYFLGGVENWLGAKYNQDISVDQEINFTYKSLATNMRGWMQNSRNGASYAVINSELRLPIARVLTSKPIKSQFVENFQCIGFMDVGTAYNGYTPFSEQNAFNKVIIDEGPVKIVRSSLREPIIGGYGFGFRSTILAYFVRLDRAWGLEPGYPSVGIWHLSIGMDF